MKEVLIKWVKAMFEKHYLSVWLEAAHIENTMWAVQDGGWEGAERNLQKYGLSIKDIKYIWIAHAVRYFAGSNERLTECINTHGGKPIHIAQISTSQGKG